MQVENSVNGTIHHACRQNACILASYSFAFSAARMMAEAEAVEPAAGTDASSTCSAALGLAIVLHVLDCEFP